MVSGRDVLRTLSRSQMILIVSFSPASGRSLSKTAQFEPLPFLRPFQCSSARLSASTKAVVRQEVSTVSAGAHSIGNK